MSPAEMEEERRSVQFMLADLETVGGPSLPHRMLSSFAARLTQLLDPAPQARAWSRADAHALVGVAGMLGFRRLAAVSRAGMDEGRAQPPECLLDAAMDALGIAAALLSRLKVE